MFVAVHGVAVGIVPPLFLAASFLAPLVVATSFLEMTATFTMVGFLLFSPTSLLVPLMMACVHAHQHSRVGATSLIPLNRSDRSMLFGPKF